MPAQPRVPRPDEEPVQYGEMRFKNRVDQRGTMAAAGRLQLFRSAAINSAIPVTAISICGAAALIVTTEWLRRGRPELPSRP